MVEKEFCIRQHKKMWDWISKNLDKQNMSIYDWKKKYWKIHKIDIVKEPSDYNYCFCCLYACSKSNTNVYDNRIHGYSACNNCLVHWKDDKNGCKCCNLNSEYKLLKQAEKRKSLKEMVGLCSKIANLKIK